MENKKLNYIDPSLEIIELVDNDVIVTSVIKSGEWNFDGGNEGGNFSGGLW